MQTGKLIAATAALLVSTQAGALDARGFKANNTGHLIELCSVTNDDPLYNPAMAFCLGYIDAALDYHAALTGEGKRPPITCPPASVTREDVVVVVRDWASKNPQHADSEAPVYGVMRAVSSKWPCA